MPAIGLILSLAVVPAAAVACGYVAGSMPLLFHHALTFVSTVTLVALIPLGFGLRRALRDRWRAGIVLSLFTSLLVVCEPIRFISHAWDIVWVVALSCPVVVALMLCLRRGAWWLAAGSWLVLFAGTFALSFNVRHTGAGLGFYSGWLF